MCYDNSNVEEISLFLAFSIDVGLDLQFLTVYESLGEIVWWCTKMDLWPEMYMNGTIDEVALCTEAIIFNYYTVDTVLSAYIDYAYSSKNNK